MDNPKPDQRGHHSLRNSEEKEEEEITMEISKMMLTLSKMNIEQLEASKMMLGLSKMMLILSQMRVII